MTDTLDTELPGKAAETDPIITAAETSEPVCEATSKPEPLEKENVAEIKEVASTSATEECVTPAQAEDGGQTADQTAGEPIEAGEPTQSEQPAAEAADQQPADSTATDATLEETPEKTTSQETAEETTKEETEEITSETPEEAEPEPVAPVAAEASPQNQEEPAKQPEETKAATDNTPAPAENLSKLTQEDIVARLRELSLDAEAAVRADIDALKQAFYRLHNAAQETAKAEYVAAGGNADDYKPVADPLEEPFKEAMATIKAKRSAASAEIEKQKEYNLQVKLSIIEELKELVESPEDANKSFAEFKKLQQQWNEVKLVPQNKVNELWKSYQHYVEQFYDLLKLNNAFREYDFKKNLKAKTLICETAERLAQDPDVVSAFHQLQKLHQQYRDTGPVARDMREQVWARFKAASTAINRRHQQHFEALKEAEQHNLDQKTVICEIIEGIDYSELKTFNAWESKTKEIIALQAKWKTIGFAPQKMNVKIFERFRHGCDEFFQKKAEFFKALKEDMNANLEKKRALCEQAEALKESTDWRATSAELSRLQKEWKSIGPVAKKHSDAIWKRFIGACDYFFDRKAKATSSQRNVEHDNLQRKREVIQQLEAIDESLSEREGGRQVVDLIREWNSIGHVPFREKDKIFKRYHTIVEHLTEVFNISPASTRASRSYGRQGGQGNQQDANSGNQANRERDRLIRTYEALKAELQTYENNLGFLTASSSRGSSLVDELGRKASKLKEDLNDIKAKIKALDAQAATTTEKADTAQAGKAQEEVEKG